jgi:hypothetical protein
MLSGNHMRWECLAIEKGRRERELEVIVGSARMIQLIVLSVDMDCLVVDIPQMPVSG